jgi:hypothetical protein
LRNSDFSSATYGGAASTGTPTLAFLPTEELAETIFCEMKLGVEQLLGAEAGSKNQTNPLKRRDRLVWFFMHFRGPKALHGRGEAGRLFAPLPVVRNGVRDPPSASAFDAAG